MHKKINYAFIDSQNLNLGTSKDIVSKQKGLLYKGWKLDFKKFRIYLANKFRVEKAFIFIGYSRVNELLYKYLQDSGFEIIYKETVKDRFGRLKGNIDAELVLYSARIKHDQFDQAIVVSGDGDFKCLYEYLISVDKLLAVIIPNRYSESSLLRAYSRYKTYLSLEKEKLELKSGRRCT